MLRRKLYLLLLLLMAYIGAEAQAVSSCAESRLLTIQRKAVATPAHQQLMNRYDMTFYKLDLQLERNSLYIAGNATLQARARQSLDVFAFELHQNFQIDSVVVNGKRETAISRKEGDVAVALSTPVPATQLANAVIYYKGTPPANASAAIGNGFNRANTPFGSQVTWSLSEPYAAYEWWPTKQVLTDKADSVHVFVTTSAENKVGSNGVLTKTLGLPNNKVRHEWKSRYPIAYYLVSVAVSDYEEYTFYANPVGTPAPVPVVNYIYKNSLQYYKGEIDMTAPLVEHFSELFTLYPFAKEKYGHSMAPMGGGMEHQTMSTVSGFDFQLNAHELAHQWFGDNVTCASWKDIWLNEGFASYAEYLALQRFRPDRARTWLESAQGWAKQDLQGSVQVPDTSNVSRIFNFGLSYKKGAAVVHMLRYKVNNDKLFFQALRHYQQQYGGGTATTEDLQQVFEQTTGLELNYFFDQWYRGNGFPVHTVEWAQEGNSVTVITTQTPTGTTPLFIMDIEYRFKTSQGDTTVKVTHNELQERYQFNIRGTVQTIEVDPDRWLLQNTRPIAVLNADEALPAADVVLYPNPASDYIYIKGLPFLARAAKIYDTTGKLISSRTLSPLVEVVQLEVSGLRSGLYLLHLSNGTQHYKGRFFKAETK